VFDTNQDGDFEVFRIGIDGSGLHRITRNEGIDDILAVPQPF
jgi:hypothetical protein